MRSLYLRRASLNGQYRHNVRPVCRGRAGARRPDGPVDLRLAVTTRVPPPARTAGRGSLACPSRLVTVWARWLAARAGRPAGSRA